MLKIFITFITYLAGLIMTPYLKYLFKNEITPARFLTKICNPNFFLLHLRFIIKNNFFINLTPSPL
jgi:hypothetical protein